MEGKNKKNKRSIDDFAGNTQAYLGKYFVFISKTKISTWKALLIILFAAGTVIATMTAVYLKIQTNSSAKNISRDKAALMQSIKFHGCVADGLLSNYGNDTKESVKMIERSECQYLHRALETWLAPPDFAAAQKIMKAIKKDDLIYGMFLAEAIRTDAQYYYAEELRNFNFRKMCRDKSEGAWGENTCQPSFANAEYQKYLDYITRKAIDSGIQVFLFGQIQLQEKNDLSEAVAPSILSAMRNYARSKDKEIIIGAQTDDITNEKYLRLFDYIEGGVGLENNGKIEKGACSERWKKEGWCWALVWNEKYSKNANDVLIHFDWSGRKVDDLSTFARMDKKTRSQILLDMRTFFTNRNIGFLFPLMGTLDEKNGGCYGPEKKFYSASREYSCQDEETINEILKGNLPAEKIPAPPTKTTPPVPETITPATSESTIPVPEVILPESITPTPSTTPAPTTPTTPPTTPTAPLTPATATPIPPTQ